MSRARPRQLALARAQQVSCGQVPAPIAVAQRAAAVAAAAMPQTASTAASTIACLGPLHALSPATDTLHTGTSGLGPHRAPKERRRAAPEEVLHGAAGGLPTAAPRAVHGPLPRRRGLGHGPVACRPPSRGHRRHIRYVPPRALPRRGKPHRPRGSDVLERLAVGTRSRT